MSSAVAFAAVRGRLCRCACWRGSRFASAARDSGRLVATQARQQAAPKQRWSRFASSSSSSSSSTASSSATTGPGAVPPPPPRTGNFFMDILHEILFYSPVSAMVGFTIGGLGATFFGALYFLHKTEYLDVGRLLQGADRIEFRVRRAHERDASPDGDGASDDACCDVDAEVIAIKEPASGEDGDVAGSGAGATKSSTATTTKKAAGLPSLFDVPLPLITLGGWCIAFVATAAVAYTRARLRLQFREFVRQVNFSLTSVDKNNVLRLRTIKECTLNEILPDNPAGVNMVVNGARGVQRDNPFIALPASQYDLIMNQILNAISPLFAHGFLAEDQGLPVTHDWYYFGITFRKETIKMRKLRVVLAKESLLKRLAEDPSYVPHFESPEHHVRLDTLRLMTKMYLEQDPNGPAVYKNPTDNGEVMRLCKLKIALPVCSSSSPPTSSTPTP
ncbi:hypothetical protein PTSG_12570 [Salpingoeca rosetta]|uniref:Uncharacterized protein n=1 Tax=Salpingoeca rosetta (strain ATCC 50818 / BSB-021) TaxID=946362 RepID=F2UJ28_SALR5|nr:uncharacterized protein PTSG_12570 [Salpingoeca rosetta]EGD76976.1 hypothetical protein PTSG_12570 [Salpingoeca rosetta]|eukprot:XP_004990816.1 hypothetical protein PTSG_12570 [Salpingoeca rosetta]